MKAIVLPRYGSPDVLRVAEVDRPIPKDDEVLVKVHAAALNPLDWHAMTGTPMLAVRPSNGFRRPKQARLGVDFSGRVEAVGAAVTNWRAGDEVFGVRSGAIADFVCVRESGGLVRKPTNLSFVQAAGVPVAALTAWQGLVDKGGIAAGQKVLVIGASGGVGTFAVQIAKALGAHVTGVCGTGNVELVRSLGADRVVDYTRQEFLDTGARYDLILDNVGTTSLRARRRALVQSGTLVVVSGPKTGRWLGPMSAFGKALVLSRFPGPRIRAFVSKADRDDLAEVASLIEAGKVTPVIDRTYPMEQVNLAMAYLGTGHAKAKVVITMGQAA